MTDNKNSANNIIFAIDEPENSLHISKAFSQFERLEKLSAYHQIMITTHWYGSLPISNRGNLHHLEKDATVKISSFNFNCYFESRKALPEDIMIKSYFELTSSIISSMRADKTNWIICEGSDDKLYLEYYLSNVPNLKVFSFGGCGNVVKLYKYFYVPFSEREESDQLESKVLCLIDTDPIVRSLEIDSEIDNKKLKIARMQIDYYNKAELKKLKPNGLSIPTEIEDCLNPRILFDAINLVINSDGTEKQKDVLKSFEFNDYMKISRVKGEQSIFKPLNIEALERKNEVYSIFENNRLKYEICKTYIKLSERDEYRYIQKPELFKLIEEYFTK